MGCLSQDWSCLTGDLRLLCVKAVITTRILGLVHELCIKRIHVTKRDLFYTDVKLFEVGASLWGHAAMAWD